MQPAAVDCAAKHTFCKACIRPWLLESCSQCPNCRAEVTELRSPPDAETAESIPTRQQRTADDGAPLEEAAVMDAALEDFIADQRELRRDFDAQGGEVGNWSARVEERGAPEQREARRLQRRGAAAEAEEVPVEEARLETSPASASPMPSREQLKWRVSNTPEDVVGCEGVTQQLYDAAMEAGTLLVRPEHEAKEWEARRSPLPAAAPSNLLRMHALTLATPHA